MHVLCRYLSEHHYSDRAPWLRAAVLGANDGLVSVASIILGVGAASTDLRALVLSGTSALVAGAFPSVAEAFLFLFSAFVQAMLPLLCVVSSPTGAAMISSPKRHSPDDETHLSNNSKTGHISAVNVPRSLSERD